MPKKSHHKKNNGLPRILIIGGVLILAVIILLLKGSGQDYPLATNASDESPLTQLNHALDNHRPILAFYHSLTCIPCKEMTATVAEVYPEFSEKVVLIDVNVYDERNQPLLRWGGIRSIPTVVFYDRNGDEQVRIGVMEAEQLRQTLAALAEED